MSYGAPQPGTILLGKYRIERVLGEGGMGVVAQAHHLQLDEPVAIKFLLPQVLANHEVVQRFLREAQAAVKLKSEHVARVIDVGTLEHGAPYMVMEYLEGGDLGAMLKHYGPLQPSLAADLMLQTCDGLAEAHAIGIVHRDLKPSNLFVTRRRDGSLLLKVLDFGISKAPVGVDGAGLTRTQAVMGTPAYMSPEQMRATRTVDARSDIWSLGVVLYELLGGRRPFESEAFSELCLKVAMDPLPPLVAQLPQGLDAAVARCLEKVPEQRTQNVAELAAALAPYASDPAQASITVERCARTLGVRPQIQRSPSVGLPPTVHAPGPSSVTGAASEVMRPTSSGSRTGLFAAIGLFVVAAGVVAFLVTRSSRGGGGTDGTAEPAAKPAPETKPEPEAKPEPETKPVPVPAPEPVPVPVPVPAPEPEAKPEPEAIGPGTGTGTGTAVVKKKPRPKKPKPRPTGIGDDIFDSRE